MSTEVNLMPGEILSTDCHKYLLPVKVLTIIPGFWGLVPHTCTHMSEGWPLSSSRVGSSNIANRGIIEVAGVREEISSSSGSK